MDRRVDLGAKERGVQWDFDTSRILDWGKIATTRMKGVFLPMDVRKE